MEEKFDLKPYIEALIQKWMWIAGGAVLVTLVALVFSDFSSSTYKASALVAVTGTRQIVEFDSGIESRVGSSGLYRAYPVLATSDELLLSLLDEVKLMIPEVTKLSQLRGLLGVKPGKDPSLFNLEVSFGDPGIASEIANRWAELFVIEANEVFGAQGGEQLSFYEGQLASAAQELQQAQDDVTDFQARNRSIIIENKLTSLEKTQADYLAKQRRLVDLQQNIDNLLRQLEIADGVNTVENQLAAVVLQLGALTDVSRSSSNTPVQLLVDLDQISITSHQEQIAFLHAWQDSSRAQVEEIESLMPELESQILTMQADQQLVSVEGAVIERNYLLAEETYMSLARKVEEEKITSEVTESGVKLASRAAVPESTEGSSMLSVVILAFGVGALISIVAIVALTWWNIYMDTNRGNEQVNGSQ